MPSSRDINKSLHEDSKDLNRTISKALPEFLEVGKKTSKQLFR